MFGLLETFFPIDRKIEKFDKHKAQFQNKHIVSEKTI